MYSRAEKESFFKISNTPGPGAYTLSSDRDYREENVPFRFKVGHTTIWQPKPGPPPNAYTIKYRKHRIKGAIWSKMTEKKPFGKYQDEVDDGSRFPHRTAEDARWMKYLEPNEVKPKLCRGRPKVSFLSKEEDSKTIKDLDIRKLYKKTYRDNMKKSIGCDKYKGPKWSKYKAKRFPEESKAAPSPNDYGVEWQDWQWAEGPINEQEWYEDIRFYKRATAKVQRFADMIECDQVRNDEPGPADTAYSDDFWKKKSFNVKGTFGNPSPKLNVIKQVGEEDPSSYSRNDWSNDLRSSDKRRKYPPFNVTSTREQKIPEMPGPADHNPPQGTVQFKLCKKLPPSSATFVAPFGTTAAQRPLTLYEETPDPATYDTTVKPRRVPYGVRTTTFTLRRDTTNKTTNDQLSPAYYDLLSAYKNLKEGCSSCKSRKPFNSTASRFVNLAVNLDFPGPSTYAVNVIKSTTRTAYMGKPTGKRTADVSCDTPGPGSYDIHPLYKDSVVRAHCTHNVTLVPYPNFYPIKPDYGPPLPKAILKSFVKGSKRFCGHN